jgi:hypothetical protein
MSTDREAKTISRSIQRGSIAKACSLLGSLLIFSFCVALLTLAPTVSVAQVSTGDILGNITDASGAALPGASAAVNLKPYC